MVSSRVPMFERMARTAALGLCLSLLCRAQGLAAPVRSGIPTSTTRVDVEIVDEAGGGLPGVTVTVDGPGGQRTAVTDATGRVVLSGLPPGTYKIQASMEGFGTAQRTVTLGVGQSSSLQMTLGGPVPVGITNPEPGGGGSGAGGGTATPSPSAPPQVEVLDKTSLDDLGLDTLLAQRAATGWSLDALIPRGERHSLLVFRRRSNPPACSAKVVPGSFDLQSLRQRLAVHANRRFAGVHFLTSLSYAIVLCDS